ncbi:FtsX-like permease family protein [Roseovarius gaetbuli]|uniref:FtsX-like permease family protein n=1 Tax=Roseovarius gaetbuli TaxID=1356575 RepID=A0A1X7ADN5_9RHOB|nr:ABC transporter permease [Roseovarius gaetbuli]SLN77017.1 FtsX-like permease family protein [Roseovarius gaetbuli]
MLWLSLRSLSNRRFVATLTVLSIGLSVALILGVERLREGAREGFTNSASGIDLIVAPRGNSVQILMATVFGVGSTGTGLSWATYQQVEDMPQVAWAVPVQMGDNHRGYPVIGTTAAYFDHFRHSGGQSLMFASGHAFDTDAPDAAVVGAEVAERFGYAPGVVIVNAHGAGAVSFDMHDDAPFTITGILAPTGTAVDRMVFVTLQGFDDIHASRTPPPQDPFDTGAGASGADPSATAGSVQDHHEDDHADHDQVDKDHVGKDHIDKDHADHGHNQSAEHVHQDENDQDAHLNEGAVPVDTDLHEHETRSDEPGYTEAHGDHHHEPETINAVFVGLSDRTAVLGIQRTLSELRTDPVSAVMPAVALAELWGITGTAENVMRVMAWAVAVSGMIGMMVMLSATLDTRRREFAILRSVGATPYRIFGLILSEAAVLSAAGLILGILLLTLAAIVSGPILTVHFGVTIGLNGFGLWDLTILAVIFCAGLVAALIPSIRVYRMTLADGLSIRI